MKGKILGTGTLAEAIRHHLPNTKFIWCAWDTPIKEDGTPDSEFVLVSLRPHLAGAPAKVVVTSQLRVGTCWKLEREFPQHRFISYPENVRALHAVEDFGHQPRIVLGSRQKQEADQVAAELSHLTNRFIFTTPETAEMVKHGLNGFLALSIGYARELAKIAEVNGADPQQLAECLMSDPRIGERAYLKPAGGLGAHLSREVHNLIELGAGGIIQAAREYT